MLKLHHEHEGTIDIITVDGVLNADTSHRLESLLETLTIEKCPNILIDAEKLTYISSAGVGCFIGAIQRVRSKKGDLRFSGMTPSVYRIFKILDLQEFFKFFPNRAEGVASFSSAA